MFKSGCGRAGRRQAEDAQSKPGSPRAGAEAPRDTRGEREPPSS
jgi:hypothetical protein